VVCQRKEREDENVRLNPVVDSRQMIEKVLEDIGISGNVHGEELLTLCPLHNDHDPSLSINLRTGLANCLGACGRGWTLFQFVKEVEKLGLSGGSIKKIKEYKFKFDREAFVDLPLAYDNKYLLGRNLTDEDVKTWDIRFGGASIVIPVYTRRKRLLGAVYRMLIPGFEPRYMNQVGKGHLFGVDHFVRGEDDMVIVVEGPMDCINMHKLGFANTVATLGIQVTAEQLVRVKRLANNVFLLFDKDENNAGQKTTLKVAEFLLGINDVKIPDYSFYLSKDPGEMRKEEVDSILKNGFSYLTWKLTNMSRISAEKSQK
jgi:DNA primase